MAQVPVVVVGDFIDHDNGTVTDIRTGLMWMRCAIGQVCDGSTCIGQAQTFTWAEAMALRHDFAGHDDWRLPDIDELKGIVNTPNVFPHSIGGSTFWSSSPDPSSINRSPFSIMEWGKVFRDFPERPYRVRLVRDGQALGADDAIISKATSAPAEEATVTIQPETHLVASTNIIDSPIREEASGNFVLHSDGTVTDTRTGLIWMRCALGKTWNGATCTGNDKENFTWDQAMALRHDFAGHDDWRLPSIDELKSIVDKTRMPPAIDTIAFPNAPDSIFWSSSRNDTHPNYAVVAWSMGFGYGCPYVNSRKDFFRVRLVRGRPVLGILSDDVASKATSSPTEDATVAIQVARIKAEQEAAATIARETAERIAMQEAEKQKNPSISIVDSPIREEASGHFVIRSDGTVMDTHTGLMWMRCALGQTWDGTTCTGNPHDFTWGQALAIRHSYAGHDDWRLPDIDELKSIVGRKKRSRLAIDTSVFPNTSRARFWSASPYVGNSGGALSVNFGSGYVSYGGDCVRLVRAGQILDTLNDGIISKSSSSPIQEGASGDYVISGSDEEGSKCLSQGGHAASASTEQCSIAKHWTPKQRLLVQQRAETLVHALKNYLSVVANQSNDRKTREQGLQDARYVLTVLKRFPSKFPFLHLDNLQAVESSIIAVEAETRLFSFGYAAARMVGDIIVRTDDMMTNRGASVSTSEMEEFFTQPASNSVSTDFHIPALSEWDGASKLMLNKKSATITEDTEVEDDGGHNTIGMDKRESGNFIINRDGTATDTRTVLMWMRCALGQTWDGTTCKGKPQDYTWDQAVAIRHSFAGHDDWRLPDIDELKSIVDRNRKPAIDTSVFPNKSRVRFWSASPPDSCSDGALVVSFSFGHVYYYDSNNRLYVRLVRAGQNLDTLPILGDENINKNDRTHFEQNLDIQPGTHLEASTDFRIPPASEILIDQPLERESSRSTPAYEYGHGS